MEKTFFLNISETDSNQWPDSLKYKAEELAGPESIIISIRPPKDIIETETIESDEIRTIVFNFIQHKIGEIIPDEYICTAAAVEAPAAIAYPIIRQLEKNGVPVYGIIQTPNGLEFSRIDPFVGSQEGNRICWYCEREIKADQLNPTAENFNVCGECLFLQGYQPCRECGYFSRDFEMDEHKAVCKRCSRLI